MANLRKVRGDDSYWALSFTATNGTPLDLTGFTIWITLKSNPNDSDINAVLQKVYTNISNPTAGLLTISVLRTDDVPVGTYYYDIQLKDSVGNIITPPDLIGKFTVLQDITLSYT